MLKTTFLFLLGLKSHSHARDALDVLSKFPPQVPSNFAKSFRDTFFFLVISIFLILEFLGRCLVVFFHFSARWYDLAMLARGKYFRRPPPEFRNLFAVLPLIKFVKFYYCCVLGVSSRRVLTPNTQQRLANNIYDEIRGRTAGPRQGPNTGPAK